MVTESLSAAMGPLTRANCSMYHHCLLSDTVLRPFPSAGFQTLPQRLRAGFLWELGIVEPLVIVILSRRNKIANSFNLNHVFL